MTKNTFKQLIEAARIDWPEQDEDSQERIEAEVKLVEAITQYYPEVDFTVYHKYCEEHGTNATLDLIAQRFGDRLPETEFQPAPSDIAGIRQALETRDYGRWDWDQIDCSWTGKDADLEAWGDQGLHLDTITETEAVATVHILKTIAGDDVCLNDPDESTEAEQYKARDLYLELAQEIVCDSLPGEWDGDSWILSDAQEIRVPLVRLADGSIDSEKTADALIEAGESSCESWEETLASTEKSLNLLSGWENADGDKVPCGTITEGSVWHMVRNPVLNEE
jgi:hypothetical protein